LLLGFGLRQQAAWKKLWPALLGSLLVLDALFLFGNQLRYFYYIGPVQRNLQGVAPWSLVDQFRLAISEWGLHSWVNPNLVWLILAGSLFGLASWTWHISKIFRRPPQADFRPWLVEQGQRLKKINPLWWIAILYFLAALIWATSMPADTFWSLDEGGKYIYLQNVIQTGDLAAPLVYPGLEHDPGLNFVPLYFFIKQAGAIFSWWPVWFPLTSLPFFRIFGWAGLFCLPALAGAFSVFLAGLIFQTIQPQKPWLAQVAALLTGLATPLAFYATRYWEHTLASAFFLLAAWLLLRGMQNGRWWMFLVAGFSGALAAGFRLDVAPLLLGFGLYLLIKNFRPALLFGGSFVLSYLPLLIANRLVSGNFFGPTYISIQALQMGELLRNLHKTIPHILFNAPAVGAFALPRWMLIVGSLALLAGLVLLFIPRLRYAAIPFHLLIVLISGWVLFQPELYRSVHGLVLIAPLIVFGGWVLAFRGLWKQSPFVGMAVCGMGVFGIIYLLRGWSAAGGLQWGPRYMLSLYPLLIIFAVLALNQMLVSFPKHARTLAVSTFILAALIGVGYEVRGLDTARRTVNLYHSSGVVVRQITEPLIFTRCTWLGMVIPDLYWQGNLYTGDPAAWEAHLQGQGFRNYLKLDMISCNTETIEKVEQAYKNIPGGITIETINLP